MVHVPHQIRISEEEAGSIAHFSQRQCITEDQTRELIKHWGNDHSILTAEALKLARPTAGEAGLM